MIGQALRVLAMSMVVAFSLPTRALGDVRLPAVIGDNMVMQRGATTKIWGWADAGEKITLSVWWRDQPISVEAAADGRWAAPLEVPAEAPTRVAGRPASMVIQGKNRIELANVAIGEVWLCSGQSNMEWSVGPHVGPGILNFKDELRDAQHPDLRLFLVQKARAALPAEDCVGRWNVCTPETVAPFSATAYFFGRELQRTLGVPVGLIATSWGGTEIELWMSEPAMREAPAFRSTIAGRPAAEARDQQALESWNAACAAFDPGADKWNKPDFDDSTWKVVDSVGGWDALGLANFDGVVWYRVTVELPAGAASQDVVLELGAIDDADRTWMNGQLVGATDSHVAPRVYAVPAAVVHAGKNTIAVRAQDYQGPGGFTTQADQPCVRVGSARIPLRSWRWSVGVEQSKLPPRPSRTVRENSTLFNAMIAPLTPHAVRGFIWYQGEANVSRAAQYRTAFPAMIADWRKQWGRGDLPFYFVQIAPFDYRKFTRNAGDDWPHPSAELRDAQRLSLAVPNTGMVVVSDITADVNDIHPPNKQDVGKRLALWALARDYGKRGFAVSGPLYRSMSIEGATIRVRFDHVGGGLTKRGDGDLTHFQIAGADQIFVAASARIDGDSVVVSAASVTDPKAVRFAWTDTAIANLFNVDGLPASSFRTDDWPVSTDGKSW